MSTQIKKLLNQKDDVLHDGSLGLLCNQTSFDVEKNEYLFQSLAQRGNLKRIFLPEHGLYAELQDQIPLVSTEIYKYLNIDAEFISLYGISENSLYIKPEHLTDLDALVIDIQDVGSRYYTFATTVSYIFNVLKQIGHPLTIYLLDRPNPAGRQVEGTLLPAEYSSFVGRPGLPHRHGLTIGELCRFYQDRCGGNFKLNIISISQEDSERVTYLAPRSTWEISPSPNMPGPLTPFVYAGQCLLEGTNLSEGRGTTRPFEIFGAPYLNWIYHKSRPPLVKGAVLRPLRFVPTFHKHAAKICDGFQLHLTGQFYHSLSHSLKIIHYIKENSGNYFSWRKEVYEYRNDRLAIEILVGDSILLDYINGRCDFHLVKQALAEGETNWINQAKKYLLYSQPLFRGKV